MRCTPFAATAAALALVLVSTALGWGQVYNPPYPGVTGINRGLDSTGPISIRNSNVPTSNSYGWQILGTSIEVGCCAGTFGDGTYNGWVAQDSPVLGGNVVNRGISGAQIGEINWFEMVVPIANASGNPPLISSNNAYFVSPGTNDVTQYGTNTDKQEVYKGGLRANLSWLAVPIDYKAMGYSSACARTGTWVANYIGAQSSTKDSSLTCSLTSTGTKMYVAYILRDGSGGTASMTIDGGAAVNLSATPAAAVQTLNGLTYSIYSPPAYTVTAGAHTVVFTITSATDVANKFDLMWVSIPPAAPVVKRSGYPRVKVAGVLKQQNDANAAVTAAYDSFNQAAVAEFQALGLDVEYLDNRSCINQTTDMNDALHPAAAGHAKLAACYRAAIQPVTTPDVAQGLWTRSGNSSIQWTRQEALITLSTTGTTTDSVDNLLPANAMLGPIACGVNTTITTAANWSVGDSTDSAKYCDPTTSLTAGNQVYCGKHITGGLMWNTTARKLRITTNVNPGAGKVHCVVYYWLVTAPTS